MFEAGYDEAGRGRAGFFLKKKMMVEINKINNDVAYMHEGEIFINKHLYKPEFDELREWILQHELKHDPGSYTKHDFMHDFTDTFCKPKHISKMYFRFFFTHPSAWTSALPFGYNKKHNIILFDLSKLWQFVFVVGITLLLVWWLW